jgi:hypothetical protein
MKMRTLTACLLAGAMSLGAYGVVVAQAAPAPAKKAVAPYKAPKNTFGQPDLEGAWTNASLTKLEREASFGDRLAMTPEETRKLEGDTAEYLAFRNQPTKPDTKIEDLPCSPGFVGTNCGYNAGWTDPGDSVMRVGGQPRASFITFPANGRVPPAKGAAAGGRGAAQAAPERVVQSTAELLASRGRVSAAAAAGVTAGRPGQNDNPEGRSLGERCLVSFGNSGGPVMLPLLYNNNYWFMQNKDEVAIEVEMVHDVRHIRLNAQHRTDGVRPWFGDSIGHYDGDTLVVETTNFPRAQAFRGSWQNLKVTEKFRRVSPSRMLYQFTVEDPSLWDAAWGGEYEFGQAKGIVYEYACHEGNYALEGILAGARAEEVAAASKSASAVPGR